MTRRRVLGLCLAFAFVLIVVVVNIAITIGGQLLGDMDLARGRHLFNPLVTMGRHANEDLSLMGLVGPMTPLLYIALFVVFWLNVPGILGAVRQRRALAAAGRQRG